MQVLQRFSVASDEARKNIWSEKDQSLYVGNKHPTSRVDKTEVDKNGKEDKKGSTTVG